MGRQADGARAPCGRIGIHALRIRRNVPSRAGQAAGLLGRRRGTALLAPALGHGARRRQPAVLPLVRRRPAQHLLQLPRPAHRARPRQAARAGLRQPGHRHGTPLHLQRASRRGSVRCRRAGGAGRGSRRPRDHLHADGARGGDRHAGVRPHRRRPLGGLRRIRAEGAGRPHRRRAAETDSLGLLRHRGRPGGALQAAARRRHRALVAQAGAGDHPPAAAGRGPARRGTGPRLARDMRRRRAGRLRAGSRDRPPVHPLHLRHHRHTQGRGTGQRRACRRPALEHGERLRRQRRRSLLGRVGHRLGRGSLVHRVRPRCCVARPPSSTRASRSVPPIPAPSGA